MKNFLKKWLLPSSLMGRLQVLVVLPILFIISVNAYIFFERHWYEVQLVLVRSVVRELAHVINYPAPLSMEWREAVGQSLDLDITFTPDAVLPEKRFITDSNTDQIIALQMRAWIQYDFDVDTQREEKRVYFWVALPDGVMEIGLHRKRVESFTIRLMIGFVFFTAILFSIIAALFMRKQVQPLVALTRYIQQNRLPNLKETGSADLPKFGYSGATEVQELTRAFAESHHRQAAAIRERIDMLQGISHDLRTPLTRMKLHLEMMASDGDVEALNREIGLMTAMLDSYLDFVRQNSLEEPEAVQVSMALSNLRQRWLQDDKRIGFPDQAILAQFQQTELAVFIRPQLLLRAFDNVLSNGLHYGNSCTVTIRLVDRYVLFIFDDDGPGIPIEDRAKALAPFTRLDDARRGHTGGAGLGLALVQETMIMHEGSLELSDSDMGGLRVILRLPVVA